MASEWRLAKLGDFIKIEHGWPFKSDLYSDDLTGKPIVVSIGNFNYTGGFRFGSTLSKEYRGEYPAQYDLNPGEVLLVMTCQTAGGEILGIPARVPDDGRRYLHNQRLGKVVIKRPMEVIPDFLYFLFLTPAFNRELVNSATGTKILHTAPSRIETFQFRLPPPHEQRAIAHILRTLDDKIELNRRMNETLEAMARALFQSWFVDFDPVRAKAAVRREHPRWTDAEVCRAALPTLAPEIAALFPDSFENSALGDIPKDWKLTPFSDTVEIIGGGTPKTSVAEYWDGNIPWFSVVDAPNTSDIWAIDTEKRITLAGVENSSTKILPERTTIISARGTVGRLALTAVPMAMNQSCYGLRGRLGTCGTFTYLTTRQVVSLLQQGAHGSVFDTITRESFQRVHIPLGHTTLVDAFEKLVEPCLLQMQNALVESRTLAALRDTLLPKLISGELRVSKEDNVLSEAKN